ncbi:hypothetical protein WA026_018405 [Henosepilachna vigintioctopunctata]|uniref:Uncharacterized protein n=1 Tax=Henosepilachna vigintioctopunctata TaxID=420089 RepID=A0AAW1V075_9CUCU
MSFGKSSSELSTHLTLAKFLGKLKRTGFSDDGSSVKLEAAIWREPAHLLSAFSAGKSTLQGLFYQRIVIRKLLGFEPTFIAFFLSFLPSPEFLYEMMTDQKSIMKPQFSS